MPHISGHYHQNAIAAVIYESDGVGVLCLQFFMVCRPLWYESITRKIFSQADSETAEKFVALTDDGRTRPVMTT